MPFTFCHPAIILPFKKFSPKYVSMTGLIIGSMLPDFEYFIRLQLIGVYGHTFAGMFYFDLPLGIILCFVFHNIVRDSLINSLPGFLYNRFSFLSQLNWNHYFRIHYLIVVVSILIGTASHIFWDAFTHPAGFFVERIPLLAEIISIQTFQIPVYKILQHGGTLAGGFIIMLYVFMMPAEKVKHRMNINYWLVYFIIVALFICLRLFLSFTNELGDIIATGLTAGLLSFVITSSIWKYSKRKVSIYKYRN